MRKVIAITGPTASGKTRLSIDIAKHYNLEIINGDSVQIYRGLDIGSAKIKDAEKENIRHHLIDLADPDSKYSVYDFQRDARKIIDNKGVSLLVGGTGLYIKAVLYDYEFGDNSKPEFDFSDYEEKSNEELYDQLLKLDPDIKIDKKNRRRVIRATELALSGNLRSEKLKKDEMIYDALIIYLDLDKSELEKRLERRLYKQIEDGFVDEVKDLKERNIYINAVGYKSLYSYLDGNISLDEAKKEIITRSKQLAKKQKTFFKNQMNTIILSATDPDLTDKTIYLIDKFLNS